MTTRRNFLKVLGLAPAAAPAAKAALEKQTLDLMVSESGAVRASSSAIGIVSLPQSTGDEYTTRIKMADYLRMWGKLPDHVMAQIRAETQWVAHLDFDIANKRSWSLAAKVHEQRQRNMAQRLARIEQNGVQSRARQLFAKTFGFEFLTW